MRKEATAVKEKLGAEAKAHNATAAEQDKTRAERDAGEVGRVMCVVHLPHCDRRRPPSY